MAASMPFQIDCTVCSFAVDFRPAVRTTRALMFGRNQVEAPELRIGHDLFSQRSTPGRDDLDHGLHFTLASAGNQFFCNACLASACSRRPVGDAMRAGAMITRFAQRSGYSRDLYITYTSTNPFLGWRNAPGKVPTILNPSCCHRWMAGVLVETT